MKTADYAFDLPPERIAQVPADKRSESRLFCYDRVTQARSHRRFHDLLTLIPPGDMLVINASRVLPARLHPFNGDPRQGEVLFLQARDQHRFEALVRPGRKFRPGKRVPVPGDGELEVEEILETGIRVLRLHGGREVAALFREFGEMPLPPYISSRAAPPDRYQTVFATQEGSVAAPTAGLHFDPELLDRLRNRGVAIGEIVLHVGLGTFKPIEAESLDGHVMHEERFFIPPATAETVQRTRSAGGKIWACGTTCVRTLESAAQPDGTLPSGWGRTKLFIQPGYTFRLVDHLITNFHLPRSTLLVLVSAFAGRETVLSLYEEAIREQYRFYSFGDAMVIV